MRLLVALTFVCLTAAARERLTGGEQCWGTSCPGGCCEAGDDWYCCPDLTYCSPTPEDCPQERPQLARLEAEGPCRPDEMECPNGFCPMLGWYCCVDWYCAAQPEDCPIK